MKLTKNRKKGQSFNLVQAREIVIKINLEVQDLVIIKFLLKLLHYQDMRFNNKMNNIDLFDYRN